MAGRFIKIYEQIMRWEWYRHPNTLCLFIYLLLKANYCDLDFHGRTIRRGQLVTTLPNISTGTGLSIQQARTSLKHLVSTGEITDESSNQYRIITVVNYDRYQSATGRSTGNQQATNRQPNRQSTDDLTASIEYIEYIDNNRKIERKDKDVHAQPQVRKDDVLKVSFEAFWACYPKKRSKPDAERAWKKINPNTELLGRIMDGLSSWMNSYDWMKENGRYIPYPASWLNNRGWEDEIPVHTPVRNAPEPEKPARTVIAQQYEQRDYSGVDDDIRRQMDDMMADYRRNKAN